MTEVYGPYGLSSQSQLVGEADYRSQMLEQFPLVGRVAEADLPRLLFRAHSERGRPAFSQRASMIAMGLRLEKAVHVPLFSMVTAVLPQSPVNL